MNRISSPKDNDAHSAAAANEESSGDDFSPNDLSANNTCSSSTTTTSPASSSILQQQQHHHHRRENSLQHSPSLTTTTAFGELDGPLLASSDTDCPVCRQPFKQPRLLMCLHAFCEQCIVAMLENSADQRRGNGAAVAATSSIFATNAGRLSATTSLLELDGGGRVSSLLECELESSTLNEAPPPPGVVRCPICKQDSQIGNDLRFVQSLQLDFVTMNLQDATAFERQQLICESCKTKEKAVARCQDCANVLCPNCVQAHQFMRCFENHKVLTFEEMKNAEKSPAALAHRPITCPQHPTETIRLFCATCRVPVCNECLLSTHKFADHNFLKPNSETETAARDRLKSLMDKGHTKIDRCNNENQEIESKLQELQNSVDRAKINVEFAFEKYQTLLNNRREKLLIELNQLQTKLENEILRTSQQIGNTSEKIRDAISFTERLLKHGNVMELLCTMSVVEAQLLQVIHSVPSAQFQVKINFVNDEKLFDQALPQIAGYFHAGLEQQLPRENFSTDQLSSLLAQSTGFASGAAAAGQNFSASSMADFGFSSLAAAQNQISNDFSAPVFGSSYLNGQTNDTFLQPAGPSLTPSYLLGSKTSSVSPTGGVLNGFGHGGGSHHSPTWAASTVAAGAGQQQQHEALERALSSLQLQQSCNGPTTTTPLLQVENGLSNGGLSNIQWPSGGGCGNAQFGAFGGPSALTPPSDSGSSAGGGALLQPMFSQGLPTNLLTQQMMSGLNPPIRQGQMHSISIRCKIGSLGPGVSQFNSPHGFCLAPSEDIVVADTNNHRIQIFDKNGNFKGQFGVAGKDEGQLWYPRKVAILRHSGKFIICDRGSERSRMQLFNRSGNFIKKIAIRYIDIVAGLCVDQEGRVVAVDSVSPTVFCIDENGELIHWFDCSNYMKEPSDIAVYDREYFICDFKGHCVCVFNQEGRFLRKIGCEGVTNFPNGIDVSDAGDVLVGDSHGNRFHVAVFKRSGELQVEYECPYVKVSRCCGLRITSEGYIITIAKNNHHVLILDTLYIAGQ